MKYFIIICVSLCIISCASQKITTQRIEGDLTFKSVSLTNFHGATEAQYQSLLKELDDTLVNPEKYKNNIKLYRYVAKLEKHKILTAPQIHLYIDKDSLINVSST
jgi:hypothetical protein